MKAEIYIPYMFLYIYIYSIHLSIYAISKFNFQNIYISLLKNLQFQEAVLIKMKLSSELNLKSSAYLCRLLIDPVFAGCEFGIGYMSASSLLVQLWNHRTWNLTRGSGQLRLWDVSFLDFQEKWPYPTFTGLKYLLSSS